jgi:nucleotide-binding universal stress UspA family protein
MDEVARLILWLAMAGVALTLIGGVAIWIGGDARGIRRGLRKVLGRDPDALLAVPARGRGVGFDFAAARMAVTWDSGAWCLVYALDDLLGAELLVDGAVAARVHRGETRRALDVMSEVEAQVSLRLVFDDAAYPDFELDLWLEADGHRRSAMSSAEAAREANRWLSRIEAVLRRPGAKRDKTRVAPPMARNPAAEFEDDEESDEVIFN